MTPKLSGTVALVTGASSGIGAATARELAALGASVALVARRRDRLEALAADIENDGGSALVIEADITDRARAEAAVEKTVERFGQLDILVNNAGLMLLGPVLGADPEDWDRMISVNIQGLLYTTHAALPHLLKAAEDGQRQVADIVNISSIAGRVAWGGYGVYNLTKFGVNGFTESLRQEVTQRHVRVGVLEPGGVDTELASHNTPEIQGAMTTPFYEQTDVLAPADQALEGYLEDAALLDSVAVSAPGTGTQELLTQHLALIQDLGVGLETLRLVQHGPNGYVAAGSLANGAPMALQGITTSAVRSHCSVTVLNSTGGLEVTVPDPDAAWPAEILVTNPAGSTLLPTLYESAHRSTWARLKKHLDGSEIPTDLARFSEVASAVHRLTSHRATP